MRQKQCERCGQWHDPINIVMSICKKCRFEIQEYRQQKKNDEVAAKEVSQINKQKIADAEFNKQLVWLKNSSTQGRFEKILEIIGREDMLRSAISIVESTISRDWILKTGGAYLEIQEAYSVMQEDIACLREKLNASKQIRVDLVQNLIAPESMLARLFSSSKRNETLSAIELLASRLQTDIDELRNKLDLLTKMVSDGIDLQIRFESEYRKKLTQTIMESSDSVEFFKQRIQKYQESELPDQVWIPKQWWSESGGGSVFIKELLVSATEEVEFTLPIFSTFFYQDTTIENLEGDLFQDVWVINYEQEARMVYGRFIKSISQIIACIARDEYPDDPRPKDVANVFWDGCYPLRCLTTEKIIKPKSNNIYVIYYASNENPSPSMKELNSENLTGFMFYKFINASACKEWCKSRVSEK